MKLLVVTALLCLLGYFHLEALKTLQNKLSTKTSCLILENKEYLPSIITEKYTIKDNISCKVDKLKKDIKSSLNLSKK